MQYLGEWRFRVADGQPRGTTLIDAAEADRGGCQPVKAFSRVFKLTIGQTPATWRKDALGGGE